MNPYITNTGSMETASHQNGKKTFTKIIWNGNYNGQEAAIDVNINNNGLQENMSFALDNDDILKLLNTDPDKYTIDERLNSDFLSRPSLFQTERKKKRKTIKKKQSKTKKRKNN